MNRIRVGDEVQVIAGKDKGKRGKVLKILPGKSGSKRVIVEGLKLVKKHVRPNPQANIEGGIVAKEAAIDISNVAFFDAASGKVSKVGVKVTDDGKKVRYLKSTQQVIEQD
ncbi:MAG: ribosomal protein [Gammaproteobacteria bacterium]|jgi:large subunit ribosomal protein L24|nr:ribosomal protein [Gammaproteobacteria bacterium]